MVFSGHRPMYIDSTNDDAPEGDLPVGRELKRWIEVRTKGTACRTGFLVLVLLTCTT